MKSLTKYWGISLLVVIGGGAVLHAAPGDGARHALRVAEDDDNIESLRMQVNQDLRHVRRLQDVARRANDIIKLTCVNDVLVSIKGAANVFDTNRNGLSGIPDDQRASYINTTLKADVAEVNRLKSQADACLGEQELSGESSNSYNGPPFSDDPTAPIYVSPIEPPVYASPFH